VLNVVALAAVAIVVRRFMKWRVTSGV
jgi:hypothetical protein